MTITEILQIIHKLYEKNTDYPDTSSDDYLTRLTYCNAAINLWESEKGIVWATLFTDYSSTLTNNVTQYNAPANFIYPSDFLVVIDSAGTEIFYEFCRAEKVAATKAADPNKQIYWMTGIPGALKINISPTPTTANGLAGRTFRLPYFKTATQYTTGAESDTPDMTDPWFIVYWVLSQLYLDDVNTTQADIMVQLAQDKLVAMRLRNEAAPFLQPQEMMDIPDGGFGT